jgi:hypothetical protein
MATSTGPCARRSAAGSALAAAGAPLPKHLAPALAYPLVELLVALNDAGAPLEEAVAAAAEAASTVAAAAVAVATGGGGAGVGDPEAVLAAAGALDVGSAVGTVVRGDETSVPGDAAAAAAAAAAVEDNEEDDDDDDYDDNHDALERDVTAAAVAEEVAAAAEEAAAATMGVFTSTSGSGRRRRHPARILLCGAGAQGQAPALAAVLHMLQGVPAFTLSLASLISEGGGDPALGCVRGLRELLRQATRSPSLLHLSRLEAWALASAVLPRDW